ncbi:tetratricopeptide repeat protein [Actibacterium ureilyticum]|uniref:tetratricopeptide repeat protein n=1 Tax=Actibacterium ureilyticum TaxID=1590614 RepID=UPI000BAAC60B|nr:tetratricopeptide repeat protein [Actibacterium ureilyticum]
MRHFIFLLMMAGAPSAWASDCPVPLEKNPRQAELLDEIRSASDSLSALHLTNRMWEIWATAPDDHAQELLNTGIERRAMYDLSGARKAFDALIAYCPDYAEGYNQRAFVSVIEGDPTRALPDLNRAVRLSPEHFAARTGQAMVLMQLGRTPEAATALKSALALNPWLPERIFLQELAGQAT